MLFNSFSFLIFFIVVVGIFWALKGKAQRLFLLLSCLFFYAYWNPPYLILLLYVIALNYACALKIYKTKDKRGEKGFLVLAIIGSLIPLLYYKYINFFFSIFYDFTGTGNAGSNQLFFSVFLPLGISFFTFQAMAYTVDVYRDVVKPKRKFSDFALFISFFQQLIAGPIMRSTEFFPQLRQKRRFGYKKSEMGFYLILWGLLKKVVIADNLAPVVSAYFSNPTSDFFTTWFAIYAFAFQIYCDFSGYCDIALGCAKILDFNIPLNFRQPYLSTSITSFWHNWHITLSSWFRDYVYIPIGGSKRGMTRLYRNLLITMILAGLWHGANYTFLIWGAYHGVFLIIHKLYLKFVKIELPKIIGIILTFHIVCVGWIFFRAQSLDSARFILSSALNFSNITRSNFFINYNVLLLVAPLIILQIMERRFSLKQNFIRFPLLFRQLFVCFVILIISIFGVNAHEFIYFEF